MKKILLVIAVLSLYSCDNVTYDDKINKQFNELKSPVILLAKRETAYGWQITVIDSTKNIQTFEYVSILANTIGVSKSVGDTLK